HHEVQQDGGREGAVAGVGGQAAEAPGAQEQQHGGEDAKGQHDAQTGGFAQREHGHGDDDPGGPHRPPPPRRMSSRRSSRLMRTGSTACTRAPATTRSPTRSGTTHVSSPTGRPTVHHSPSRRTGPVADKR